MPYNEKDNADLKFLYKIIDTTKIITIESSFYPKKKKSENVVKQPQEVELSELKKLSEEVQNPKDETSFDDQKNEANNQETTFANNGNTLFSIENMKSNQQFLEEAAIIESAKNERKLLETNIDALMEKNFKNTRLGDTWNRHINSERYPWEAGFLHFEKYQKALEKVPGMTELIDRYKGLGSNS